MQITNVCCHLMLCNDLIFTLKIIDFFKGKTGRWTRAYHLRVPPPPMPPQPQRGGPRQRVLPTPRGVNMIIWSLDNRFVLAAIMGKLVVVVLKMCFFLLVTVTWSYI